ncbi:MAG: FkbM family methyltransferase [Desulfobaccales bacterium]
MVDQTRCKIMRFLGHQNWLRFGIRDRIIRYFVNPDTINSWEYETDFFGLRYKGNLNTFLDWFVYFYGAYEKEVLFFLRDLVSNRVDPVFLDVGANVGQHSIFMSKFCHQVHAFEPYEKVRNLLLEKIAINHIDNIIVHDVGLGERDEYLDYYAPIGVNTGTGSFLAGHASDNNRLLGKLRLVKGDYFLPNLNLDRVDLIKIDVEGFEKFVLTGLKETISIYRPLIFMEFGESTRESFASFQELSDLLPEGYNIQEFKLHNRLNQSYLFSSISPSLVKFDFSKKQDVNLLLKPS